MPLKIQLKPKERIIINGAVVEGNPDGRTEIIILNNASVMRQKHIMQEEEANTPSKRLYFTLQMLYIDQDNHEQYKPLYENFRGDLERTVSLPVLKDSLNLIKAAVDAGRYYDAMKICRDLVSAEDELLKIN
ncbi:MAG TPA: flagellar biosynthesis repressor FlbT [Alphaproteobacteria bacterium]